MIRHVILVLLILIPCCLRAGALHERNKIADPRGGIRYFHYYLPGNLQDHSPLVILFHGGSQDYSQILKKNSAQNEWLKLSEEKKFLLIIPNGIDPKTGKADGTNQHWNDCREDAPSIDTGADDTGFVSKLIDWAIRKFKVDELRVYATGASNGGMMSYRIASELSPRIAAIATFVANLPRNSECKAPTRPVSVFLCNGTKDTWMPWNGGVVKKGGVVLSALQTRNFWIQHNSTSTVPAITKRYNPDRSDGTSIHSELFNRGKEKTEVMFYTVKGGGHTIPSIGHLLRPFMERIVGPQSHDMEGAVEAWKFLSGHAR